MNIIPAIISAFSCKRARRWMIFLLLLVVSVKIYASAGGGGGGGSSHDDDGGGLALVIYYIMRFVPFPYNIILIVALILLSYYARKKFRSMSGLNRIASFEDVNQQAAQMPPDFYQRNPAFSEEKFREKVRTAFMSIQDAWMKQDLSGVRKWITDGVWQRFHTQFVMMQALGQKNTMDEIEIRNMTITDVKRDGNYDIIDVAIHFTMQDNFVTEKFPELSTGGELENVEYWTFVRKSGVPEKDMYHSENCPQCGSQLPKNLGEVAKCEHCGTITTLGDYDWVLSEITQSADYANESSKLEKDGQLTGNIRAAMSHDADFSVQFIEDKASNAYMQILSAMVARKPERMRRFVDNAVFEKVSAVIANEPPFVFNRLYLNNVTMMDYYRANGKDNVVIALKRTSQKVDVSGGQMRLIDYAPFATNEIMVLSRDAGAGVPAGSLYAHSCPSCGGPIGDTLDLTCSYCGAELNSTKHEWIVTQLMLPAEYLAMANGNGLPLTNNAGTQDLDPLFKVRDYALNNVMVIIAADGEFKEDEMTFAVKLAKKLGYDPSKISGLLELAKNNQLTIRLPEERKKAEKVFEIMVKAASADGNISSEEQAVLDSVRNHIMSMAA